MRYSFIFLLILVLSACSTPSLPTEDSLTPTPSTGILSSYTPAPSMTVTPTPSLTISPKPSPTDLPTDTPTPSVTIPVCINKAEFVRHLSVSDNTEIVAGTFFAKVWRVKNVGTCSWTTDYWFVFKGGDNMSSPFETQLYKEVPPGETIDIQVVLVAPMNPNTYHGDWIFRDQYGLEFGSGEAGDQPFSANIVVEPYKSDFKKETLPCG